MHPRLRRLIAMVGVLAFLVLWVWGVIALRGLFPASSWIDFAFFAIGGTLWGLPLIPLLNWAERGRWRR